MMFSVFIPLLESAINRIISLDPEKKSLLKILNNEAITIYLNDWDLKLTFIPTEHGFHIYEDSEIKANATLSGDLISFLKISQSDLPQMSFYSKEIKLSGQLKTVLAYRRFYLALSPELSFWLEPYLGKTFTHFALKPLKQIKSIFKSLTDKTKTDLTEYLQEEKALFPPKEIIDDFYHDILITNIDAERLVLKFEQIKNKGNYK